MLIKNYKRKKKVVVKVRYERIIIYKTYVNSYKQIIKKVYLNKSHISLARR